MQFHGVVQRGYGRKPDGSFEFVIKTNDGFTTNVTVPSAVVATPPPTGAVLNVSGENVRGNAGWEIKASNIMPALPDGDEIVDLLTKHPMLRILDARQARKLWRKLRGALQQALANWDSDCLIGTVLPPNLVSQLLGAWHRYVAYVEFIERATQHAIPHYVQESFFCAYGTDSLEALQTKPYRLAQFMKWEALEAVSKQLELSSSRPSERHVAAILRVLEAARLQGHCWISEASLVSSLGAVLTPTITAHAVISDALEAGACEYICLGNTIFICGRTHANMYHRLVAAFEDAHRQYHSSATSLVQTDLSIDSLHDLVNITRARRRCIVRTPSSATCEISGQMMSGVIHVFPTDSAVAKAGHTRVDVLTVADILRGRPTHLTSTADTTVIIHEAHILDLVCLNKLTAMLPESWSWCLLGDDSACEIFDNMAVFRTLLRLQPNQIRLSPSFKKLGPILARHRQLVSFCDAMLSPSFAWPATVMKVSGENILGAIRATFLRAASKASAIVVCETAELAVRINGMLAAEALATREYLKQKTTTLQLPNGQRVGVGDPIIYLATDLARALLQGARGEILEIYEHPKYVMQHNGETKVFVADAKFETSTSTSLTETDLSYLDLAFAIAHHTRSYGKFDEAVCVIEHGLAEGRKTVFASTVTANTCTIIVSHDMQPQTHSLTKVLP
jgi:hypothetical protein